MLPLIVVVEDEPSVGQMTRRMVQEVGYRSEWVGTGGQALEMVETGTLVDLFIIDLRLPDMSGIELARRVSRLQPKAPVIFISGYPEYRLTPPGKDLGSFLPKPYSLDELADVLRQLLPLAVPE